MDDRLQQAFLRGYYQAEVACDVQGDTQTASVVCAVSDEVQYMRASIDACEEAIAQLGSLPPEENEQLKTEARASLETLADTADHLIAHLRGCLQSVVTNGTKPNDDVSPDPSPASAKKASPKKKAQARKIAAKKTQSKKRRGK